MHKHALAVLVVASFASFPGHVNAQSPEEIGNAVSAAYADSFNEGDVISVAALYAEDAVVMAPNAGETVGRDAIAQLLNAQIEQFKSRDFEVTTTETLELGERLAQAGTYRMMATGPGGDMPITGDWLSIAQQGEDGEWRIIRHIWNMDMPQGQ
jgi:uncharacterized protein (TIGR02246 family)